MSQGASPEARRWAMLSLLAVFLGAQLANSPLVKAAAVLVGVGGSAQWHEHSFTPGPMEHYNPSMGFRCWQRILQRGSAWGTCW